ncbi:MAG: holo-ACP synthase [Planctomycetota bacterium]
MIRGIGIDIIETARIRAIIDAKGLRFLDKAFTAHEQAYCRGKQKGAYQSYGARFAAKEAVFKVLGTGWQRGVGWKQVEIRNDHHGKPAVFLCDRAAEVARELGISGIHLSLSHTEGYCAAFAVGEGDGPA